MAAYLLWLVGAAPPLWVNGKPDSTNPRKGCTASVGALRPELFVVLAGMQVNESNPIPFKIGEVIPIEVGMFTNWYFSPGRYVLQ